MAASGGEVNGFGDEGLIECLPAIDLPDDDPPCAGSVPMLLWALLASGPIQMRKIDGWETLSQPIEPISLDLAA